MHVGLTTFKIWSIHLTELTILVTIQLKNNKPKFGDGGLLFNNIYNLGVVLC